MMKEIVKKRDNCRLCESTSLELALALQPTAIAEHYVNKEEINTVQEKYGLNLHLCNNCGHLQMIEFLDPQFLFSKYRFATSHSTGLIKGLQEGADRALELVAHDKNSFVVEIGSNDGSLLQYYKNKGMKVLGVDPAKEIARRATETGLETMPEFFTSDLAKKIKKEKGEALIIVANNVYAHSDDLEDMTKGVRELLHKDGIFVFEVSYLADIVEKMLFDTIYHEHVSYHSIKPLARLFERNNLELIKVERIKSKGGSIRGIVQKLEGQRQKSQNIENLVRFEEETGLDKLITFHNYGRLINKKKENLQAILDNYRSNGAKIAGYGSSPTVNTLIHHFELERFMDFIALDTEWKQGLFTPGHHIPLLHPKALIEKKPEYTIILAWNYANQIIEKNKAYLENGGRFIIPLPEIKIV